MSSPTPFPNPSLQSALRHRGFKVGRSNVPKSPPTIFGRRHFYKIVLSIGNVTVRYGDRLTELNGIYLFIANPRVPYSVEIVSETQTGYSCLFTPDFIQPMKFADATQQAPLFDISTIPVYKLNSLQKEKLSQFFEEMITEEAADYEHKDDLMRLYIAIILHETIKMRSDQQRLLPTDASSRITKQFIGLLEGQFPVENIAVPLSLHTAQDFANSLNIHVNSLNRSVKRITGKSTTTLISERIVEEAIALLKLTDWTMSEIACVLGFEYPNYFSTFFKKHTGKVPRFYRTG